jgi:hypothetical protein
MNDLIERVAGLARLDPAKVERALGLVLSSLRVEGNRQKVDELFAMLPGAQELAETHHGEVAANTGPGGTFAAISKLKAHGLTMDEIVTLGAETLDYAQLRAGGDLVRQVAGSIPSLSGYV